MKITALITAIIIFMLVSSASFASIAVMGPLLTIDQLIDQSDVIAVGKIIKTQSYLDEQGMAFTDMVMRVEYYLGKSKFHDELLIQLHGGNVTLPTGGTIISEEYQLYASIEDRMCVFLTEQKDGKYRQLWPNGWTFLLKQGDETKYPFYEKAFNLNKIYPKNTVKQRVVSVFIVLCVIDLLLIIREKKKRLNQKHYSTL